MTEAAPAEAGAAAEKKRPLLRRVPTSLVVTLLGIALTAWLLPAFTRQWDDRQKAHELKTAMVADMASATAAALIGGEAVWAGRPVNKRRVADAWSLASLTLEARLRAYFGRDVINAWQVYSWMIDHFADGHRAQAEAALLSATNPPGLRLDPGAADAAALVLVTGGGARPENAAEMSKIFPSFFEADPHLLLEKTAVGRLYRYLKPSLRAHETSLPYGKRAIEATLLRFEEEIAREVLDGHAKGYSTSDFLQDLIP